jgi:hypothetical protein
MSDEEDLALLMEKRMAALAAKKKQTQANEEALLKQREDGAQQKAEPLIKTTKPKREKGPKPIVAKPLSSITDTISSPDQLTTLITKIVTQQLAEFKHSLPGPNMIATQVPIPSPVPHTIISKKAVIQYIKANATKGLRTWLVKQNRVNDLNFLALMVNDLAFGVVEDMLPVPQTKIETEEENDWDPAAEEGWVAAKNNPTKEKDFP